MSDERDLVQMPLTMSAARVHRFTMWQGIASSYDLVSEKGQVTSRAPGDVITAEWFDESIARLNPDLADKQVHEARLKLESLLSSTGADNITEQARSFLAALRTGVQVRIKNRLRAVAIIDFDNHAENRWDIATEVSYQGVGGIKGVRYDIVLYCNGIPLVVVETKSLTDPNVSWLNAALDLTGAYTTKSPAFLAAGILQIATDGREVRYGGVSTVPEQFQRWGATGPRPEDGTWEQVEWDFLALTSPALLLSWAQDFILHMADSGTGTLVRYIPRWPQAEAAPLMAARAFDPERLRGLLDQYQGSGKTMAMAMASNEICRLDPRHLVVLVVDRLDLLTQHKGDFTASDSHRTMTEAETSQKLARLLKNPSTNGIIITTVHRFAGSSLLSERGDITVMVDECHRTQEGTLGREMREALPNATLLGLTGTPVATSSKNTYETFGDPGDKSRVLHLYTPADSVHDGTTVPLVIDTRRIVQTLNQEELDAAFEEYKKREGLSSTDAEILATATTKWDTLLKDPRRISLIAKNFYDDVTDRVLPGGYGAMLVVPDREACVLYVAELRKHFAADQVTAVISGDTKNDPASYAPFIRDSVAEAVLRREFRDPTKPLKVFVVTSKLLTGFNAPNCLAIFIDKPMKGVTLFQGATRANRTWTTPAGTEKPFGVVVDYCGITEDLLRSFNQATPGIIQPAITTPEKLVTEFKRSLTRAERLFGDEFDWEAGGVVHAAMTMLARDPKLWRVFRQNVNRAELIVETLPSEPDIRSSGLRLKRLLKILHSVGVSEDTQRQLLLLAHGPAVKRLVLDNTGDPLRADIKITELTPEKIAELVGTHRDPFVEIQALQADDVMDKIRARLRARMAGPHAYEYQSIADKLEKFSMTSYILTIEGVQTAAVDLINLVKELKAIDDRVGEEWVELDIELFGWSTKPQPVLTAQGALKKILDEYSPKPMPVGLDTIAAVLDDMVDKLSYRKLRNDVSAQKSLQRLLVEECKRIGVLPNKQPAMSEFVDHLLEYINIYLV